MDAPAIYWTRDVESLAAELGSSRAGLSPEEVARRLAVHGPNALARESRTSSFRILLEQFRSPLVLILGFAAIVSLVAGEVSDTMVVGAIVLLSAGIGFIRERGARTAIDRLRARLTIATSVVRGGVTRRVPATDVVPGDIVLLSAGALVPADGVVWDATDLHVNEAILTGETFPAEKRPCLADAGAPLSARAGCVFMGTNVRTGTAHVLIVGTGAHTTYGQIASRLRLRPPETEFDRGIRQFGYLLTTAMLILVLADFAVNVAFARPLLEALLFAVALAVGLSPELLRAILSVNLAQSARTLAASGVLVRRLPAIENLGSMDILCTDKTGTVTEGEISILGSRDVHGRPDASVLALAARNARLQTGLVNPIDEALLRACPPTVVPGEEKLAEIPYDFVRKRLSVIVRAQKGGEDGAEGGAELLTKGAVDPLLAVCTRVAGGAALDAELRARVEAGVRASCEEGLRVLAVARRSLPLRESYTRDDERDLELVGFVLLTDPPKEGVSRTLGDLRALGVGVKIISGDNHLVVLHVARAIGFESPNVLTGGDLDNLNDEALWARAEHVDLFAEVDPNQKERIILALKKMGHVVGFMGDGVNDAPAMHAADTSISVESAVDVARDAADFVLLEKDLDVLRRGILAGRITFANTLKYIQTTISANLGNMISMAIASLFLPFLPLLAGQILLNNFLSDVPAFGLAGDAVDPELTTRPRRWDLRSLRRFMIRFGLLSSLFDFATFGVLLLGFRAAPPEFRTAWFLESLLTELVVALVVRTRRRFYRSRPGRLLLWSTIGVAAIAIGIPYVPVARTLGFVPLPATLLGAIVLITLGYAASAEGLKRIFYRMEEEDQAPRERQRMPALTPKISSSAPMS